MATVPSSIMIDTHCHIDDPQYSDHFDRLIHEQQACGVSHILVPATDLASCHSVLSTCGHYPGYLFPALGLHPEEVHADYPAQLQGIRALLLQHRSECVAIGEIGLDYHYEQESETTSATRKWQQEALAQQLDWAEETELPVMIHSRDAMEDTINILSGHPRVHGVMHCYSGSYETAARLIAQGWYLGIGGVLTFKNCKLSETLKRLPLERLVLETDAPYMAPVPHRGEPNQSKWMIYVAERLASVYECDVNHILQTTTENAKRLFHLK